MTIIFEGNHEMNAEERQKRFEEYFGTPIQNRIENLVTNGLGYTGHPHYRLSGHLDKFGFNSEQDLKFHLMIMDMKSRFSYHEANRISSSQEADGTSFPYFSERGTPAARAFAEDRRNAHEQIRKLVRK